MSEENKNFSYTYRAPTAEERREIEGIRRQYGAAGERDDLTKLRALDARVKNTAKIWGISLGVSGTLIFGLGLSMILEWEIFAWGALVAAVGAVVLGAAYPAYRFFLKKGKDRYREEILRLSEKLLQEKGEFTKL